MEDIGHFAALGPGQESFITKIYDKLGEVYSQWIPLEDVFYRNNELGDIEFGKVKEMNKWPDLMFYNVACARNGGPIAFMIKDNVLFIGQKEIRSIIFVFTAFGKMLKTINMVERINSQTTNSSQKVTSEKMRWACFGFTSDEDLCLVSTDGTLYLVDPRTGDFREKPVTLGLEFKDQNIVDSKLEDNFMVFRTTINQFYWISNVTQNPVPNKFDYLNKLAGAQISDYIVIPKNMSGTKNLELLIADPNEGFYLIRENKQNSIYVQDLSKLANDSNSKKTFESFGKIQYMSLNAKKDLLALYSEGDTRGRMIVLKSDLTKEFNRFNTGLIDAKSLDWCGNDVTVLTYPDKIVLVGPNECEPIDMRAKSAGIQCLTEIDGLRVVSAEKTYFLERVQKSHIQTFKIASIEPSAKLINAMKSVDLNIPRADEIIRDLGKKLIDGIECLLDAAQNEHCNIGILKQLLKTASFAKKFADPQEFDANRYVNVVKHMIVLTKIRNSPQCGRAMTYKQFEKYKAKNVLRLLMKQRDYKLAIQLIEILNLKQYLPQVYEDWCVTMLKYSTLNSKEIMGRLVNKFEALAQKIAIDQGNIPTSQITASLSGGMGGQGVGASSIVGRTSSQMAGSAQQFGAQMGQSQSYMSGGVGGSLSINQSRLFQQVKLNIDFTKLAKIADSRGKQDIADFLISNEKSIVKKIPFLLEVEQYDKALVFAMDGGDPNIINKVLSEIFKKRDIATAIQMIAQVPEGLRHLRNFAKKRNANELLVEVMAYQKQSDFANIQLHVKMAYAAGSFADRNEQFKIAQIKLDKIKDDFYAKTLQEMMEVNQRQIMMYGRQKDSKDTSVVDSSINDFIQANVALGKEGEKELKDLKNYIKIPEKSYFMMIIRALAQQKNWNDVTEFIKMKKPPVSFAYLAEICHDYNNDTLAVEAIKKISDPDEKIQMLIDFGRWQEAVEETFSCKKMDHLDDIRQKGPKFVEDFIRDEMQKRQKP